MLILPPCFGLRVSIYDLTLSPRPVTHCRPYHSCWYFYYSCCCCFCCRCRFSALHLRQFEFGIINKYSVYVVLLQTLPTHGDFASVIFHFCICCLSVLITIFSQNASYAPSSIEYCILIDWLYNFWLPLFIPCLYLLFIQMTF